MIYIYAFLFIFITTLSTAQDYNSYDIIRTTFPDVENLLDTEVAISPIDNSIFTAGYARINGISNVSVVKYLPNLTIDTSFGVDGLFNLPLNSNAIARDIIIQDDGKILVVGIVFSPNGDSFIIRLNPDGALDTSFNNTGVIMITNGFKNHLNTVTIVNNKILIGGGISSSEDQSSLALLRINMDGSYDTTFGDNGILLINVNSYYADGPASQFNTIVDFKIVNDLIIMLATTGNNVLTLKYTLEGQPTTYGGDGVVDLSSTNGSITLRPKEIFINSDNTAFIHYNWRCDGQACNPGGGSNVRGIIYKILENGENDISFNENSFYLISVLFPGAYDAIAVTENQDIYMGYFFQHDFRIKKINAAGDLITFWNASSHSLEARKLDPFKMILFPTESEILMLAQPSTGETDGHLSKIFANATLIGILGVDDITSTDQIKAYPNPSKDRFFLEGLFSNNAKVQVIDALGKVVFKKNITAFDKQIDLNDQPKGIYFIKIEGQATSLKVIKN